MSHPTRSADSQTQPAGQPAQGLSRSARTHVLVATGDDPLLWAVFEGFAPNPGVRVTACSSVRQAHHICVEDSPAVIIFDLQLLSDEPLALVTLAGLVQPEGHIIGLSALPVWSGGSRFGRATLTFVKKPVDIQGLILLARSRPELGAPPLGLTTTYRA